MCPVPEPWRNKKPQVKPECCLGPASPHPGYCLPCLPLSIWHSHAERQGMFSEPTWLGTARALASCPMCAEVICSYFYFSCELFALLCKTAWFRISCSCRLWEHSWHFSVGEPSGMDSRDTMVLSPVNLEQIWTGAKYVCGARKACPRSPSLSHPIWESVASIGNRRNTGHTAIQAPGLPEFKFQVMSQSWEEKEEGNEHLLNRHGSPWGTSSYKSLLWILTR